MLLTSADCNLHVPIIAMLEYVSPSLRFYLTDDRKILAHHVILARRMQTVVRIKFN